MQHIRSSLCCTTCINLLRHTYLQQPEETGGTGSGWDDVGRIWTSPGGTASRPAWTNPSWGLSSATVAKGLDPETRWEATTTGGRGTGRQNRPVRGWDSS